MKFGKEILLLVAIFSISSSLPHNALKILSLTVHCKMEITSKIECYLPVDTLPTDLVQIVSSMAYQTSGLSDNQVKSAKELEFNSMHMTEQMPFYIGHEFNEIEALWIIRSQLKFISKQNFDEMLKLRALSLYENQINSLDFDVFHHLVNLRYLDLDNNQIEELHNDLFIYMPDLSVLRIRENNLETLSDEVFTNNQKLEQLHLNGNKLKKISVNFNSMENLLAVNLENNFEGCDFSVGFFEDLTENEADYDLNEQISIFQRKVNESCNY